LRQILDGKEQGAPRAVVLLNAAAAIVAGEKAETLDDGLRLARLAVDSGAAADKLKVLIEATR
jgi:anthranilate phosphoribosyltransferase